MKVMDKFFFIFYQGHAQLHDPYKQETSNSKSHKQDTFNAQILSKRVQKIYLTDNFFLGNTLGIESEVYTKYNTIGLLKT